MCLESKIKKIVGLLTGTQVLWKMLKQEQDSIKNAQYWQYKLLTKRTEVMFKSSFLSYAYFMAVQLYAILRSINIMIKNILVKIVLQLIDRLLVTYFTSVNHTYTLCSGSSDPFYIVGYYIKWVTTSWTHSILCANHFAVHIFCINTIDDRRIYSSWRKTKFTTK